MRPNPHVRLAGSVLKRGSAPKPAEDTPKELQFDRYQFDPRYKAGGLAAVFGADGVGNAGLGFVRAQGINSPGRTSRRDEHAWARDPKEVGKVLLTIFPALRHEHFECDDPWTYLKERAFLYVSVIEGYFTGGLAAADLAEEMGNKLAECYRQAYGGDNGVPWDMKTKDIEKIISRILKARNGLTYDGLERKKRGRPPKKNAVKPKIGGVSLPTSEESTQDVHRKENHNGDQLQKDTDRKASAISCSDSSGTTETDSRRCGAGVPTGRRAVR